MQSNILLCISNEKGLVRQRLTTKKKKKFMGLKLFTDVFKGMTHSLDFKSNI